MNEISIPKRLVKKFLKSVSKLPYREHRSYIMGVRADHKSNTGTFTISTIDKVKTIERNSKTFQQKVHLQKRILVGYTVSKAEIKEQSYIQYFYDRLHLFGLVKITEDGILVPNYEYGELGCYQVEELLKVLDTSINTKGSVRSKFNIAEKLAKYGL
jgi:hypothetical protein